MKCGRHKNGSTHGVRWDKIGYSVMDTVHNEPDPAIRPVDGKGNAIMLQCYNSSGEEIHASSLVLVLIPSSRPAEFGSYS